MGVTIHYRGQINSKNDIDQFIVEVSDICKSMDWKYDILDEDWSVPSQLDVEYLEEGVSLRGHAGLKGVSFTPHEECEPVRLTFDHTGQLNSLMNIAFGLCDDMEGAPWNFTKTQFAGVETHISVVKLLRYINKKYIDDLEVMDEGDYWTTNDPNEVTKRMGIINNAMDTLTAGLEAIQDTENLTEEGIVDKINEVIEQIGEQEGIQVKVMRIDNVLRDLEEKFGELAEELPFLKNLIPTENDISENLSDEDLAQILEFESIDEDEKRYQDDVESIAENQWGLEAEIEREFGLSEEENLDDENDWEDDFLDGFDDTPDPTLN